MGDERMNNRAGSVSLSDRALDGPGGPGELLNDSWITVL